jgi:hypothetical protein
VTLYKGGLWHELEAVARPSLEEMMLFIAVVELLTLLGRHVCTASNGIHYTFRFRFIVKSTLYLFLR